MPENAVPPVRQHSDWSRSGPWVLRVFVMVALFILLTFTLNLLFSTLISLFSIASKEGWNGSFHYIAAPDPDLRTSLRKEADLLVDRFQGLEILERSLTIHAAAEEIEVAFQLVIPREDAHAPTFTKDLNNIPPVTLTDAFFGLLSVGGTYTTDGIFRPAQWQVNPDNETMVITLTAVFPNVNYPVEINFVPNGEDQIRPGRDKLLIDLSESALVAMDPFPHEANRRLASLVTRSPEELGWIKLTLDGTEGVTRNEARQNNRLNRRSFLLRSSSFVDEIPVISPVLFAITKAVPLLLFLWLASRWHKKDDDTGTSPLIPILRNLAIVLLFFHFTLHVTRGVGEPLEMAAWVERLQESWMEFAWHLSETFSLELGSGAWRIQMAILGILGPALFLLHWKARPASSARRWTGAQIMNAVLLGIVSLFLLAALGQIAADIRTSDACREAFDSLFAGQSGLRPDTAYGLFICGTPVWAWGMLVAGSLLLVLWGGLVILLWAASGAWYPLLGWAATALLVIGTLYRVYLQFQPPPGPTEITPANPVWLIYAIVLGLFLLFSFVLYLHSVYQNLGLTWKPGVYSTGLLLGLLLLAIPARFVFGLRPAVWEDEFLGIAYQLDDFLVLAWVAGMLFLLYEDGKSDLKLSADTRLYGSLTLSVLLFSTLARWFYIPITFLLGWAAIQWLLRTGHDWGSVDEQFQTSAAIRWKLIKHGSLVRILDQAFLQYRTDRLDQVTKGTLMPTKFKKELEEWEKDKDEASRLEGELDKELSKHPLAFGPKATAWENGMHGALWASLFALPWFLLYLVNFMQSNAYPVDYPLLDFLVDLLTIYGRWAAIGFVLGYFFPYLRGNSGLEKALWLWLAVVIPTLPLYFILNTPADRWQAAGLWALQVFIQCILLGLLAFDYQTADQKRGGFQILLELHGMRSLSLWGASLVAAIGASIITLLSSQAANLVSLTLRTLLPAEFGAGP